MSRRRLACLIRVHALVVNTPSPLRNARLANLQDLTGQAVIAAQHRPRRAVGLDKGDLELRAKDLERRLGRVDRGEQRHLGAVALGRRRVRGRQVKRQGPLGKGNLGIVLANLLEKEGGDDGRGRLVEVGADRLENLFAAGLDVAVLVLLAAADKEVALLGLAALNLHELVKLEDAALAAAVALAALVEDGHARVVDARLVAVAGAGVFGAAGLAAADGIGGDGERG
ncbi:hypothetical protein BN1708_002498, partial [Verticillium longisporum]